MEKIINNEDSFTEELNNIRILRENAERMSAAEFDSVFLSAVGATLIQLQTAEYTLLGIISHLNEKGVKLNTKFEKLTPERFLSDNEEDVKYRKQTLGVIIDFVKERINMFDNERLEVFLSSRNNFVHNFFRNHLSHEKRFDNNIKLQAFDATLSLFEESIIWTSVFKGFLYEIAMKILNAEDNRNKTAEQFEYLRPHYDRFLTYIR